MMHELLHRSAGPNLGAPCVKDHLNRPAVWLSLQFTYNVVNRAGERQRQRSKEIFPATAEDASFVLEISAHGLPKLFTNAVLGEN